MQLHACTHGGNHFSYFSHKQENGPYYLDKDTGDLKINPYSWNSNANLLFVVLMPFYMFLTFLGPTNWNWILIF